VKIEVNGHAPLESIKPEIVSGFKQLDKDVFEQRHSYSVYLGKKRIIVKQHPPELSQISFMRESTPSPEKQLEEPFGLLKPPPLEELNRIAPFRRSKQWSSIPFLTFGDLSNTHEVTNAYVSLLRRIKLDNRKSLIGQNIKEEARLFPSIDIDYATQCSKCKIQMRFGLLYYPLRLSETEIHYTILDLYCPSCDKMRKVESYSVVTLRVNDEPRRKYRISAIDYGLQIQLHLLPRAQGDPTQLDPFDKSFDIR
jgi:hypothetical protein